MIILVTTYECIMRGTEVIPYRVEYLLLECNKNPLGQYEVIYCDEEY